MGNLVEKAFEALKTLPEVDRERIAWEIIQRVEDKTEWDRIIALPDSQNWLAESAKKALKAYAKNRKKLSMTLIAIDQDQPPREEAYWHHFDDLPAEVRELAEENFHLWKEKTPQSGPALQADSRHHAGIFVPCRHAPPDRWH